MILSGVDVELALSPCPDASPMVGSDSKMVAVAAYGNGRDQVSFQEFLRSAIT